MDLLLIWEPIYPQNEEWVNWKSKTKVEGKSKVEIEDFLRFFFTCMHRVLEEARGQTERHFFYTFWLFGRGKIKESGKSWGLIRIKKMGKFQNWKKEKEEKYKKKGEDFWQLGFFSPFWNVLGCWKKNTKSSLFLSFYQRLVVYHCIKGW